MRLVTLFLISLTLSAATVAGAVSDGNAGPFVQVDTARLEAQQAFGKPATESTILIAQADTAPPDAGAASAPAADTGSAAAAETKPADKLHDPTAAPTQAFDDLKAAKKLGWGVLVLAALIMLCRLAGKLGGFFKPLGTGRAAVVIGAVGTLAIAAYNALALGGTWMAAAAAAIVALAAYWNSHAEPKKAPGS